MVSIQSPESEVRHSISSVTRTCSGVHRAAKATPAHPAKTCMPEHVWHDGNGKPDDTNFSSTPPERRLKPIQYSEGARPIQLWLRMWIGASERNAMPVPPRSLTWLLLLTDDDCCFVQQSRCSAAVPVLLFNNSIMVSKLLIRFEKIPVKPSITAVEK